MTDPPSSGATTRDAFLAGAVQVVQPAQGYRAGHDAVLLAASLAASPGDVVLEAGCGAGAALLCAAWRLRPARFQGVERDPAMLALCQTGIAENGFGDRVAAEAGNVSARAGEWENRFDQAFANPPFFEPGRIRPPSPGKQAAYVADAPLKAWVLYLLHVVKPGGRVTLIHRAGELAQLLALLDPRAGEIEVLPVRPVAGAAASRVLVRCRKGLRRGPVRLYDGLALHEASGGPATQRTLDVLAGGALEWS